MIAPGKQPLVNFILT
jgi:hypothetical protein